MHVQDLLVSPKRALGTRLSQRRTALAVGTSRASVRRIAKGLGLKSRRRLRVHTLPRRITESEVVEQQRRRLFRRLLEIPAVEDFVVMTDEKNFVLEVPHNPHNERVYGIGRKVDISPERLLRPVSNLSFAKKIMVSIGLSMRGKVASWAHG